MSMLNLRLLCSFFLASPGRLALTTAFTVSPVLPSSRRTSNTRGATIYYNQDEYCALDDCDDDDDSVPSIVTSNNESPPAPLFLQSPNILGSLARLAVAFGPHKVALKQIEHVEVTDFDASHLDLQVVICEDECLTLLVPVTFPQPCQTADEEECFIDNIRQLDSQATSQIQQSEWEDVHHEEVSARAREYETLREPDGYPDWWQTPDALSRECSSLQRLLNEAEFHAEIKALVAYNLATDSQFDMYEVDRVAVAAVGPAGMIMKASARELGILENAGKQDGNDDEDDTVQRAPKILQVPYAFSSPANDMDGIQSAVLQAVAMAGDFMED